jgi:hypothetical protein
VMQCDDAQSYLSSLVLHSFHGRLQVCMQPSATIAGRWTASKAATLHLQVPTSTVSCR